MIAETQQPSGDNERPLSYGDLRRFLLLIFALLLGAVLVHALAPVLLLFLVVFFLAMVLNAPVVWLQKRGIRRPFAVIMILLGLLTSVVIAVWLLVPPVLDQANQLIENSETYQARIQAQLQNLIQRYPALEAPLSGMQDLPEDFTSRISQVSTWLLRRVFGIVGAVFLGIIALLALVFILSNPQPLVAGFLGAVPTRHREAARRSIARLMQQMTAWTKATLINGTITGISTGLLLYFIGLPYAFVFGVLSFFGEFVPNIGPVVSAVPALFVAAGMGPQQTLMTLGAILFVQQVESNILVPFIMGRQMQLHPVTIVFFALAMGSLFSIAGAILAVPLAATAKILYEEFYLCPQQVPVAAIEEQAAQLVNGRGLADDENEAQETDDDS